MEEAEAAPGGGKSDGKGKDGKQVREARAAAKAAAKRTLVASSFWSLQAVQLFGAFLDNFTQDGYVDPPHCDNFVEEVNKVPELELTCWSQDGNCDPLKTSGVYRDKDGMLALIASLKVVAESAEKAYGEDAAAKGG